MKTIINKIFHWLSLSIFTLMLVLVLFLGFLRLANPYFEVYRHDIEKFVSKLVKQPISISKVATGNRGLEPVFKLYDVTVFNDAKTRVLLQIPELQVGIDLISSLFKWNIKPGLLVIRKVNFLTYHDKDGHVLVSGIEGASNGGSSLVSNEILQWFLEQSKIELSDITLRWHALDGKVLKFVGLQLKLDNGILQHDLKVNGKFVQKNFLPAKFDVDLKLRGDILKQTISSLTGSVVIENSLLKLPQQFLRNSNSFISNSGDINLFFKNPRINSELFRQPLIINNLEGRVTWQSTSDGLEVRINKFKGRDAWLALRGGGRILFPIKEQSPIVDLQFDFLLTSLAKAKLYYPVPLLPPDATIWLDKAFISSKAMRGNLLFQGQVSKFPFDHNEGRFLVNADIWDVHLNYNDDWPHVENINGKMIFANRSMTILADNAEIMHIPVKSVKAIIPDLDLPILTVESAFNTDSSAGLNFINSSPLKETIGSKLQMIKLNGPMKLFLNMVIPISPMAKEKNTKVDGHIVLHDNNLQLSDLNFNLNNLQGELRFTENDLVAKKLTGDLFGRPVSFSISTLAANNANNNDTINKIDIIGSAAINNIEQAFSAKLSPYITGDFKYRALLELHSIMKENVFKLESNLEGVTVDLPKPFAKSQAYRSKIDLKYYFGGVKPSRMFINYNNQINATLATKKTTGKSKMIGEINFGEASAKPADIQELSGILISGKMKKLDWPVWRNYLSITGNNFTNASSVISGINLDVDELYALGQTFKEIRLRAKPKNNGWEVGLIMPTIEGTVFFPAGGIGSQIQGVFQKFYLDLDEQNKSIAKLKPQDLLPLHFIINNFHFGSQFFNRLELTTEPRASGLRINRIVIDDPKFSLIANGDWSAVNDEQKSILRGKIRSNDIGGLLRKLKLTDNLIGAVGEANFNLEWPSAPYDPTLKEVRGIVTMVASNGRIINLSEKAERQLGLGRMLNIFSLRHLSLNFGDLTKKGFLFDKMKCDFELTGGNIFVRSIMLDGPIAEVEARGKIELATKNYDMILSTIPHITSSVPVIAAIAAGGPVGPLIGLASWFVTEKIIAPGVKKATVHTYHLVGTWDKPILEKN